MSTDITVRRRSKRSRTHLYTLVMKQEGHENAGAYPNSRQLSTRSGVALALGQQSTMRHYGRGVICHEPSDIRREQQLKPPTSTVRGSKLIETAYPGQAP